MALMNQSRVPTKQSINFAYVGLKRVNWTVTIIILAVLAVFAGVVGKFLVHDYFVAVNRAESSLAAVQSELDACNEQISKYGELNEVYAHYTYSGMTEEELALVDRVKVMDLLQRVVLPRTQVREWSVSGNLLSLGIEGDTLQDINNTVQALMADELVSYCEVHTATTDEDKNRNYLIEEETDKVTANIVVHLADRGEGEQ